LQQTSDLDGQIFNKTLVYHETMYNACKDLAMFVENVQGRSERLQQRNISSSSSSTAMTTQVAQTQLRQAPVMPHDYLTQAEAYREEGITYRHRHQEEISPCQTLFCFLICWIPMQAWIWTVSDRHH
jgi:hypothetical protein